MNNTSIRFKQPVRLLCAFFLGAVSTLALGALASSGGLNDLEVEIDENEIRLIPDDPDSLFLIVGEVHENYPLGNPEEPVELSWETGLSTFPTLGLDQITVYRLIAETEVVGLQRRPCVFPPEDCPIPWPPDPGPGPILRQDMRFLQQER